MSKPTSSEAPGLMTPSQLAFVMVTCWLANVYGSDQTLETVCPAASVNWRFHPVVAVVVPFVIVYFASYPVPQSEVLVNVAVTLPAAYADDATSTTAPASDRRTDLIDGTSQII